MGKTVLLSIILGTCALTSLLSGCAKSNSSGVEGSTPVFTLGGYHEDFTGPDTSEEVRAIGREFVNTCLAEARKAAASVSSRPGSEQLICHAKSENTLLPREETSLWNAIKNTCVPSSAAFAEQGYDISLKNGRFKIALELAFVSDNNWLDFEPADGRAAEMLAALQTCIPDVASVWARYGITFDLQMSLNSGISRKFNKWTVRLADSDGRPTSRRYYFQVSNGLPENLKHDAFCSAILHETAHLLGLADEYEDKEDFPNRSFIADEVRPWSIMGNNWHRLQVLDFYPRHFAAVLEPVCPVAAAGPLRRSK